MMEMMTFCQDGLENCGWYKRVGEGWGTIGSSDWCEWVVLVPRVMIARRLMNFQGGREG